MHKQLKAIARKDIISGSAFLARPGHKFHSANWNISNTIQIAFSSNFAAVREYP